MDLCVGVVRDRGLRKARTNSEVVARLSGVRVVVLLMSMVGTRQGGEEVCDLRPKWFFTHLGGLGERVINTEADRWTACSGNPDAPNNYWLASGHEVNLHQQRVEPGPSADTPCGSSAVGLLNNRPVDVLVDYVVDHPVHSWPVFSRKQHPNRQRRVSYMMANDQGQAYWIPLSEHCLIICARHRLTEKDIAGLTVVMKAIALPLFEAHHSWTRQCWLVIVTRMLLGETLRDENNDITGSSPNNMPQLRCMYPGRRTQRGKRRLIVAKKHLSEDIIVAQHCEASCVSST